MTEAEAFDAIFKTAATMVAEFWKDARTRPIEEGNRASTELGVHLQYLRLVGRDVPTLERQWHAAWCGYQDAGGKYAFMEPGESLKIAE
ncbi:hypothetical protein AB0O34_35560 [Sphaerisporangium sp. NPDC088356]|uniref:hypothetical protein n=1 Tax=Sphaerisporangium sp. NPDC088356 TaxID=3154871 RepID=UPI0034227D69